MSRKLRSWNIYARLKLVLRNRTEHGRQAIPRPYTLLVRRDRQCLIGSYEQRARVICQPREVPRRYAEYLKRIRDVDVMPINECAHAVEYGRIRHVQVTNFSAARFEPNGERECCVKILLP